MDWYTADSHLGHIKVITKEMGRDCFATMKEHDDAIIDGINLTAQRMDRLRILGDFSFQRTLSYRNRIRCKHIEFIIGNHDRVEETTKAFGKVWHIRVLKIPGLSGKGGKIVLCHYPMAFWPASHHGSYHLYGHVHGAREKTLDVLFPERRSMDVGVDVANKLFGSYRPFSHDEVMDLLKDRKGHDQVSYYREFCNEDHKAR